MANIPTIVNNRLSDSGVDITAKQDALSGSGIVKMSSGVASYITGASSGFVKADGTVDVTAYLSSLTGEATNSGSTVTLTNSAVIGKVLTGLNVSSGAITSSDSILNALGKIQGQINSLQGGTVYKGSWNASTNTPTITSGTGTSGNYYVVTTAGTTTIDGISSWAVGDWIIFNGTVWEKIQNVDAVTSVNSQTGAVNLTTSNISEGTNLYYTDARARAAISLTTNNASGPATYSSGVLNIPNYTLAGLGGAASATTITINGTTQDLSANRTFDVGTVTSIGLIVPTGFTASSAITTSGNITIGFTAGYALPTTASQANWDAAYNDKINSAAVTGTTTKTLTLTQQDTGTLTASWTDTITSVFGRTGAVVAANGDYTTAQVTESGNLYYTDARARAAISLTTTGSSGASTYSGGVLNVPTYTLAGLGGVSTGTTLTINGVAQDLSTNRTYNVGTVTSIVAGSYLTGGTITSSGTVAVDATTTNTASKIVARDASGNFAAGTITATLNGTSTNSYSLYFDDGPRNLSNRLPNSFTRTVLYDFVTSGTVGGTGLYAGVMTFIPWTGTTASTGDSSYQLAYMNQTGSNGTGLPGLRLRKGIDTTWGSWYTFLHEGNYTSYAPSLTGTGASGNWAINISGNAASASTSSQVTINYNNNSDASYQMLWGSGNSVYGTSGITCNPFTDSVSMSGTLFSGGITVNGFGRMYGGDFWHSGTANNGTRTPTIKLGRLSDSESPAYVIYTDDTNGDILEFYSERYTGDFRLTRNSETGLRNMMRVNSDNSGTFIDLYNGNGSTVNSSITTNGSSYLMGGNVGIGINTPAYKLDVTGSVRVSDAIGIGTAPDSNYPIRIIKSLNSLTGIRFENTSTGIAAFSGVQFGTNVSAGTLFTNFLYASSGILESGVYKPNGTSLVNTGSGGLNFLAVSQPIRFFTSTGDGTERVRIKNEGQVRFVPLASAPAGAEAGDVYYDSSNNRLRCYNGTTWINLF